MDLGTSYLGIDLKNPIVASASPLSYTLGGIRELEDAGAAAVVLYSLFEEQITQESGDFDMYLNLRAGHYSADVVNSFPAADDYNLDPGSYLELIRRAKDAVSIPIIGSLNGVSAGEWLEYARHIEAAGADAIELNLYYVPTDIKLTSLTAEWMYLDAAAAVADMVKIPVSVKISPFFSAIPYMVDSLYQSGAEGLVLFNRFYQPDLDIEGLEVRPSLNLSRSEDLTLALRWVALLHGRVPVDFAVTGGVHTYRDVIKAVMAGANVAMMAAELLQNGLGRINSILGEMLSWMDAHDFNSITKMRGFMSERYATAPEAFERGSYARALLSFQADRSGARQS